MFNIRKYRFIALLMLASLTGCKKEFLEKQPLATTVDENFYKTNEDIVSGINAAYDPIGWESNAAGSIYAVPFFFGDVVSDDAIKGGESEADQINVHFLETFSGNSGFQEILLPWQRFYTGIYRANIMIERTPASNASPSLKDRVMGEAKFLRGYYHFELVKMYGDVPLVTKVLNPDEYNLSRSSKAEVYAQIESDLKEAAGLLPEKGAIETGRATRGAAYALLARVQMYQTHANPAKWSEVLQSAETVINSKVYDLEPVYADVHSLAHENGIESVFEIQHNSKLFGQGNGGSDFAQGNEGTFVNVMFRGRNNGGWGFNSPTIDLLNEFKKETTVDGNEDPRLKATIIQNGEVVNGETFEFDASVYPFTGMGPRKYVESSSLIAHNLSDGPSNIRVIRYADVLLMAAEAANEVGQTNKALGYLKEVRDRVNMPEITETNKDLLRAKIWRERRIELALEGQRFFDLVRQGRAATVMKATTEGYQFREGVNEVFPIPLSEVNMSNGKITQNNGY